MKHIFSLLFFLLLGVANAQETDVLLQQYAGQISTVQTLQSDFVEEKHLSLLNQPIQSRGIFWFDKRAQKLLWQYQKPFSTGFLIEANKIYRLQNQQKKPVQQTLERVLITQLLAWLTLDFEALKKEYKINVNGLEITFVPTFQEHKIVKKITVWLDEKEIRRVTQVKMEEPSGDFIVWKFENTQINPPFSGEELK